MNAHARMNTPVVDASITSQRGAHGNRLRLVGEDNPTLEQSLHEVAVIGLGYVGLPLCLAFSRARSRVLGLDVDETKVKSLQSGTSYIKHISDNEVKKARERDVFTASTDFSQSAQADAVLICVPTPLTINRTPDLSYVVATAKAIAPHLREGQLIVLESTTYPGTTEEVVKPILEKESGLVAGKDFYLAYSPEREDPGNPKSNFSECPKVVGGFSQACLERPSALYMKLVRNVVHAENC
ncbi:MAG: nucleotide sugar dehydrogenase, partial [Pirellulales bacterium]